MYPYIYYPRLSGRTPKIIPSRQKGSVSSCAPIQNLYNIYYLGPIRPDSALPTSPLILPFSHSRNYRFLYSRNPRPPNNRNLPFRVRSRGTLGCSLVEAECRITVGAKEWDGPQWIFEGQGMFNWVYYDAGGVWCLDRVDDPLVFMIRPSLITIRPILCILLYWYCSRSTPCSSKSSSVDGSKRSVVSFFNTPQLNHICRSYSKTTTCLCSYKIWTSGTTFSALYGWARLSRLSWPSMSMTSLLPLGGVLKCSLNTGMPSHSICHGHKASTFAAKMYVPRVGVTSVCWQHSQIRSFIQKFYQFVEGVSQHHRNIDELLSKVSQIMSITLFISTINLVYYSPLTLSFRAMSAKALAGAWQEPRLYHRLRK